MSILRIILIIIFLIAAAAVTIVVLLQEGKSAGLGSMAGSGTGSGGSSYWEKNKKYSLEGKFERWTKIAAFAFVFSAFVLMFIPNQTQANAPSDTNKVEQSTQAPSNTETEGDKTTDNTSSDKATDNTSSKDSTSAQDSTDAKEESGTSDKAAE